MIQKIRLRQSEFFSILSLSPMRLLSTRKYFHLKEFREGLVGQELVFIIHHVVLFPRRVSSQSENTFI